MIPRRPGAGISKEKIMTEKVVGALSVHKVTHEIHLNVKHRESGLVSGIVIDSDDPIGAVHQADRIAIGGLEGFPESRHTVGVVTKVSHAFKGGALNRDFTHVTMVEIDELED